MVLQVSLGKKIILNQLLIGPNIRCGLFKPKRIDDGEHPLDGRELGNAIMIFSGPAVANGFDEPGFPWGQETDNIYGVDPSSGRA